MNLSSSIRQQPIPGPKPLVVATIRHSFSQPPSHSVTEPSTWRTRSGPRNCNFLAVVLIVLGFVVAGRLQATSVEPPSFEDLVEQAETIFEGQVTKVESKWSGGPEDPIIETFYTFNVLETLKGPPSAVYTLQVLGGTIGDETLEVEGAPKFAVGETSLLFVTQNGSQFVPLVGIMYGHYQIKQKLGTNTEEVIKHDGKPLSDVSEIGKEDRSIVGGRIGKLRSEQRPSVGMSPQVFKDQVKVQLTTEKSSASQ